MDHRFDQDKNQKQSMASSNESHIETPQLAKAPPPPLQLKAKDDNVEELENSEQHLQLKSFGDEAPPPQDGDSSKENNTGLPDELKSGIERLSGYSLDDVNVNYNSNKPAELQAHAFAQGNEIHVAPGQEKHLAHEAWHVVQQKQGRVKSTVQAKGGDQINDDPSLEKEADVMGVKAIQMKAKNSPQNLIEKNSNSEVSQLAKEVFNTKYFNDPVLYIRDNLNGGNDNIFEDAGSSGIFHDPFEEKADYLDVEANRLTVIRRLDAVIKLSIEEKSKHSKSQDIESSVKAQKAGEISIYATEIKTELQKVYDFSSASNFLKQNTLKISKLSENIRNFTGLNVNIQRQEEEGANINHTFHYDDGFVNLEPNDLEGDGAKKAEALNGPFNGRGWVPGHSGIDNYRHRFIEHVHVNKDLDNSNKNKVDIYNSKDEKDGETADKHKGKIESIKLSGRDKEAMGNAEKGIYNAERDRLQGIKDAANAANAANDDNNDDN